MKKVRTIKHGDRELPKSTVALLNQAFEFARNFPTNVTVTFWADSFDEKWEEMSVGNNFCKTGEMFVVIDNIGLLYPDIADNLQ